MIYTMVVFGTASLLAAEPGARTRTSVLFALHILTHEIGYKCRTQKSVGRSSSSGRLTIRQSGTKWKRVKKIWLPFCASESAEPHVVPQLWWILRRESVLEKVTDSNAHVGSACVITDIPGLT